jgi:tetratricopeptide (TPR) repeat protein
MTRARLSAVLIAVVATVVGLTGCGSQARFSSYMKRGEDYYSRGDYVKASLEFRNALQIAPRSAAALVMAGHTAEKLGRLPQAGGAFQAALEAAPDNLEARKGLARVQVLLRGPKEALKTLEPALKAHPDDAVLLTLRATARALLDDVDGAVADADHALRIDPTNTEAIEARAGLYKRAGDLPGATALVSAAVQKAPRDLTLREALADLYQSAGQPARAEEQLRALIGLAPGEPRYRYQLAGFYVRNQKLDDAQRVLEEAVAAMPQSDGVKLALVEFISTQRARAQGEQVLRGFIAKDPDNLDLRLALGALLQRSGDAKDATAIYQDVIQRDGKHAKGLIARNRLAAMAWASGRSDEAGRLVAEVLAESAHDDDALLLHGQMALAHRSPSTAITDLRAVLRDQPSSVYVRRLLADAYVLDGQPVLAEEALRAAMDLAPADNSLRVALARVLLGTQRLDEAVSLLEDVASKVPQDTTVREQLAITYLARHDFDKARAAADELARLAPNAGAGPYLAGLAAEGQKKPEEAEKQLRRALELTPQSYDALSALTRLQLSRGAVAEAVALAKGAVDREPGDARKLNLLGEMYLAQRNVPLASDALTRAAAAAPGWWVPYRNLAIARLGAHDLEGVVTAYQNAIKAGPDAVQPLSELGAFYETHGRADDAIALYEAWNRRNPQVQSVASYLAMLLVTYRHDQASLDRARDLTTQFSASTDGNQLDTSGWVHFKRAEYPQALTLLQRAAQSLPDSRQIRYHLAMAELRSGNPDRARQDLETALSGAGKFLGADEARATLATLKNSAG